VQGDDRGTVQQKLRAVFGDRGHEGARAADGDAAVDWEATRRDLAARGIVVLGSGADEAPHVYKDLATVLACHANIEILHTLDLSVS